MKKFLIPALALCLVAGIFISKQFGTDKETTVTEEKAISEQATTTEEAPAVEKDAVTEQVATAEETPAAEAVETAEDKAKATAEAPAAVKEKEATAEAPATIEDKATTAEKAPALTEDKAPVAEKTATSEKTPAVSEKKATPEKAAAPVAKAPEKAAVAKAPAKTPAPVAKAPVTKAPAKAPVPVAKTPAPVAQKSSTHPNKDEANATLRVFANNALEKMNRLVIPSKGKKEIRQNGNGTWTARYTEIDVNSIQTSVAVPADTKFVQYVGYMRYVDVEYICTADTKQAALNGPFKVNSKESLTELVKCQKGKWGY